MAEILHVLLIADARIKVAYELIAGIAGYVKMTGHWFIDKDISYYTTKLVKMDLETIQKRHIDGLICVNPSAGQESVIQLCIDQNIPVLARGINKPIQGALNIVSNNDAIAEMAADHLLDIGVRNFAFFGYKDMLWSIQRRDAFKKKIDQVGYDFHLFELLPTRDSIYYNMYLAKLLDWLISLPKPIGIMACNDDFGLILLQCCHMSKIHVPDEVSVVGVDNDEVTCSLCVPSLSSIGRDAQKAGFEGARLLEVIPKPSLRG